MNTSKLRLFLSLSIAAAALATAPAMAKNKQGGADCPPGLAKKNPPCVPPGLAKKGDNIHDHDHIFIDPDRYGLDDGYGWYKLGDDLYVRTDKETGEIIQLFNAIAAVLD